MTEELNLHRISAHRETGARPAAATHLLSVLPNAASAARPGTESAKGPRKDPHRMPRRLKASRWWPHWASARTGGNDLRNLARSHGECHGSQRAVGRSGRTWVWFHRDTTVRSGWRQGTLGGGEDRCRRLGVDPWPRGWKKRSRCTWAHPAFALIAGNAGRGRSLSFASSS